MHPQQRSRHPSRRPTNGARTGCGVPARDGAEPASAASGSAATREQRRAAAPRVRPASSGELVESLPRRAQVDEAGSRQSRSG